MSRRGRSIIRSILGVAALSALAGVLAFPTLGAHLVRTRALPRAEERLGRHIEVGEVRVGWGEVVLSDLRIDGAGAPSPLSVPRATVEFRVLPLLAGRVALGRVVLERPRISIVRGEKGDDNISSMLERLRGKDGASPAGSEGGSRRGSFEEIRVVGGTLSVDDDTLGTVDVARFDAHLLRDGEGRADLGDTEVQLAAGPGARVQRLLATFRTTSGRLDALPSITVEGGEVHVWKGFAVSGIRGGIVPDSRPGRANIDLRGGYGGLDKVLWSAKGWAEPASRRGELQLVAARFDLGQLAPILTGTPIVDPEGTQVDARLDLVYRPGEAALDSEHPHLHDALDFDGRFRVSGLSVSHPKLGPLPVRHFDFDATARGTLEPRAKTLHLAAANLDVRGLHASLALDAWKLEKLRLLRDHVPDTPLQFPAFRAAFTVAPVPCQTALLALPPELVPHLQGFKLSGTFKSEIHAAIDTDDLDGMDLGSKIGIDGCTVTQAPAAFTVDRLLQTFEHAVEVEPGSWLAFPVGPESPEWVPYKEISPHLVNSIMTTEDSNFFEHKGFIGREFKSALKANLEHGRFALGASSITMQTVKNVLLSSEKTLSRKLQELFLTWYIERHLSKERILEIYFNVIEFGPGIYGIGRAAKHYFGKSAKDLQPREAAFFSSMLPSPKRRYAQYCRNQMDPKWDAKVDRILKTMLARHRLTEAEYEQAAQSRIVFNRAEAMPTEKCLEMVKRVTAPTAPGAAVAQGNHGPLIPIDPLGADSDVPPAPASPTGDEDTAEP